MPDRVIYLFEESDSKIASSYKKDHQIKHTYDLVSDEEFSTLLVEGWEVLSTLSRTIPIKSKNIKTSMIILRQAAENRGVSIAEKQSQMLDVPDDFGGKRSVSILEALAVGISKMSKGLSLQGAHPGHLGAPGEHNLPGLQIVSSTVVSRARDMGMLAAKRGTPKSENPFPAGSVPATQWLLGYAEADLKNAACASEIGDAFDAGKRLAMQLGPGNDVVSCPFSHPELRSAWVRGFKEGGGTVE